MPNYQVDFSTQAIVDLQEITDYLDQGQPPKGFDFAYEVAIIISNLEANPFLWQRVNGSIRRAILKAFNYLIFYPVIDNKVVIIAIEHGRKNRDSFV